MVMPDGISGADLVEKLLASRPRLKIVFTSGYTADAVNQEMLTRSGASFLSKPYAQAELARAVRNCLDQNNSSDAAAVGH
jgi:FixJ family two-component response regulator